MTCPICESFKCEILLTLDCGNIDKSVLYQHLRIVSCKDCGHVYVPLTKEEQANVLTYYEKEYAVYNMQSPNKKGDMPGSLNDNSIKRYSQLYSLLSKYLTKTDKILDIGCSTGGFLLYLKQMGFDQLYGTDFSTVFIESAMKRDGIVVRQGTAENIPFDPSFDVLVSDQVVEHLFDPNKIFLEARRILKDNGYLCISVPNSSVYSDHYFFDFYWVLMREHVHHFDDTHLISLAEKHGFSFQEMLTSVTPFLNDTTTLPTITLVFKYDKIVRPIRKSFELKQSISKYFDEEFHKLADRCQTLNKTIAKTTKLYLFGMSRELMYLYANSDLSKYNVCGIIDDTPSKQACTFNGIRIYSSDIIKELPEDAVILITAFAHKEVIRQKIATTFKGLVL